MRKSESRLFHANWYKLSRNPDAGKNIGIRLETKMFFYELKVIPSVIKHMISMKEKTDSYFSNLI